MSEIDIYIQTKNNINQCDQIIEIIHVLFLQVKHLQIQSYQQINYM
jgi:hypothetical protein